MVELMMRLLMSYYLKTSLHLTDSELKSNDSWRNNSESCDEETGEKIRNEVMRIDGIIDRLDNGWVESDKVRRVMQKYFNDLR